MREVKQVLRRFLSYFLVMALILPLLPQMSVEVQAATSGTLMGLSNQEIGITYSGTDNGDYSSWSVTGGNSIVGSVKSQKGSCSDTQHNTTLTITNNKSAAAILSFDYSVEVNSGTIQVAGTAVNEAGSYSATIEAGSSIKIYLASGSETATKIDITNLFLIAEVQAAVTFQPAEKGSYTVDGTEITTETVRTQQSTVPYNMQAVPAEGYKFFGWYSVTDDSYLSSDASAAMFFDKEQTITAVFIEENTPVFDVGGKQFTDLNEADQYASNSSTGKITLISDGTLSGGDYTISSGNTLLIPFDDINTCYTTVPATTGSAYTAPFCFRKLVMEEGANLIVDGSVSVSARHTANGNGFNWAQGGGAPSGGYGYIYMNAGSTMTVNNGAGLYVYGYISGAGTVMAKSGATVYENMQIKDFRGGSVTSKLAGNEEKVFPINQYFVQNIETELILESGADEYIYTSLYASSMSNSTSVHFIGEGGMFHVAQGGYFTKKYLSDEDRMEMSVSGDAAIESMDLKVSVVTVSSADYVLPITNGMTLNVLAGTTEITQDVALLAGVRVNIAENAVLKINNESNLYVYDRDEWVKNNYASSEKFKTVTYSPTRTYTRKDADLTDVRLDINGTLQADGYVYTTAGGADIISSNGTGTFIMNGGAGSDLVTYQAYGTEPTIDEIPVTSAMLHNDSRYAETEEEYTATDGAAAGSIFQYDTADGKWKKKGAAEEVSIVFDANGGEGAMDAQTVPAGTDVSLTANTFTRNGYTFAGWNTASDGSGTAYADEETVNLTEGLFLYAQWTGNAYTVTWVNEDGTELEIDENVAYGTVPEYNGTTPEKDGDAQYSYTFTGWTPAITEVTGDVTYKAVFEQRVNQYTVTWKNWDGTELEIESAAYGDIPVYTGKEPVKEGDAGHTYTFSGWTPEITAVTENTEYTAVFTENVNTYTVLWKNWDGTELEKDEGVVYGTNPEYNGEIPSRPGDRQYSYTFKGWSPAVDTVTGNITYTAVFDQMLNQYTITWMNGEKVLKTEQIAYGEMPVYSGDMPAKESDEQYSYTFAGWTPEIVPVVDNAIYTALFKAVAIESYQVTFDANGGKGTMDDQIFIQGTDTKLRKNTYTRDGYKFIGWNTSADGSGIAYGDEETVINLTDDLTLYAQWRIWTGWVSNESGRLYYRNGEILKTGWTELEGIWYYLHPDTGYAAMNGVYWLAYPQTLEHGSSERAYFLFDSDGGFKSDAEGLYVLTAGTMVYSRNGNICILDDGLTVWIENGELPRHPGLVTDGTDYYYFPTDYLDDGNGDTMIRGKDYYVSKCNNLGWPAQWGTGTFGEGTYSFDAEGKMLLRDGLIESGENTYYYVKGAKTYGGLVQMGENYYYINSSCMMVKGREYTISKTNGLLPSGTYEFDANGRLIQKDTTLNGIVKEDGTWYYYVDGIKTYAGLIQIDGDYYYVNSNFEVVHDCDYYISKTNGLLSQETYTFDSEGRLQIPDRELNGIVKEADGTWYYYIEGIKTYAGLIEMDGAYYYVNSACQVIHNRSYFISKTNGILPNATYQFDEEGRLIQ